MEILTYDKIDQEFSAYVTPEKMILGKGLKLREGATPDLLLELVGDASQPTIFFILNPDDKMRSHRSIEFEDTLPFGALPDVPVSFQAMAEFKKHGDVFVNISLALLKMSSVLEFELRPNGTTEVTLCVGQRFKTLGRCRTPLLEEIFEIEENDEDDD